MLRLTAFMLLLLTATAAQAVKVMRETDGVIIAKDQNFCSGSVARVSLVHKVPWSTAIHDGEEFRRLFHDEILPLVRDQCTTNLGAVFIYNYVAGARIEEDRVVKVDRLDDVFGVHLSRARIARKGDGWDYQFWYWDGDASQYGSPSLASIAAVQQRLKVAPPEMPVTPPTYPTTPVDCAQQSAKPSKAGGPSARDICRAMDVVVEELTVSTALKDRIFTELMGKRTPSPLSIRMVIFRFGSCREKKDEESFACSFEIGLHATGGGEGGPVESLKPLINRPWPADHDFVRKGGTWRRLPAPLTP
jgi:hypothetical protein